MQATPGHVIAPRACSPPSEVVVTEMTRNDPGTVLAAGALAGALVEAGGVAAAVRRPAVAVGAVAAAAAAAAVEEAGPGVAVTTTVAVTGCFVTGVTKSRWPALTSQLTVATSTTAAAAAAAYPSLLRRGARRPDGPNRRCRPSGPHPRAGAGCLHLPPRTSPPPGPGVRGHSSRVLQQQAQPTSCIEQVPLDPSLRLADRGRDANPSVPTLWHAVCSRPRLCQWSRTRLAVVAQSQARGSSTVPQLRTSLTKASVAKSWARPGCRRVGWSPCQAPLVRVVDLSHRGCVVHSLARPVHARHP